MTQNTHLQNYSSHYIKLLSCTEVNLAAAAAKSLQSCLCDPWTAAYQASPSLGFSRQEHWSGLPFPSPEVNLSEA